MEVGADAVRPTEGQLRVAEHGEGPLLVEGPAGSGRSEALALRLGALVERGERAEHILVLTRSRPARSALRDRAEALVSRPHDELWVATWREAAERLLREFPVEAGLDPFFTTVGSADRLAILLDRVEDLPLRRHEIRGNPAGLLARLLRRIDLLKAESVEPARLREWAVAEERAASSAAERERAEREIEFADLYARHDRILRESGSLDGGDLVLELTKLLRSRADVAEDVGARFRHVLVDELEDAGVAHRQLARSRRGARARDRGLRPRAGGPALPRRRRLGSRRVPRPLAGRGAGHARGEAEGARHGSLLALRERARPGAGGRHERSSTCSPRARRGAEQICVIAGSGWREARLIAAALEERSVPLRFAGDAAFFARPEVRDALAWLRMLAEPGDAAAVVRALTRPPVELRSVDLAKVTTIARRRKLDMVSALEAALESPQLPPEARDRIQAFLKLFTGRPRTRWRRCAPTSSSAG